ncbi:MULTISPECIES: hypothetical protein [unclassified Streptomyces]|uniref:hypothetical protein n=1 Tax=unclassified Streptomyces TaxID=2593676 RepID=UPI0036E8F360
MDADDVAEGLCRLPPAQFTALRDARAAEARRDGDAATARRIAGFRKPTLAAWVSNLLARQKEEAGQLLELAQALREAAEEEQEQATARRSAADERVALLTAQLGEAEEERRTTAAAAEEASVRVRDAAREGKAAQRKPRERPWPLSGSPQAIPVTEREAHPFITNRSRPPLAPLFHWMLATEITSGETCSRNGVRT